MPSGQVDFHCNHLALFHPIALILRDSAKRSRSSVSYLTFLPNFMAATRRSDVSCWRVRLLTDKTAAASLTVRSFNSALPSAWAR